MDIYLKLNVRKAGEEEIDRVRQTIINNYKIKYNPSFYNPYFNLFSNYINNNTAFNNYNRLIKLIKKRSRIDTIGYTYRAKIKTHTNSFYHTDIFIKEIPIINLIDLDINYTFHNLQFSPLVQIYYQQLYSIHSPANIEVFTNYLVSKLVEFNISPNFCKYYGSYYVEMDRFTFNLKNDKELIKNGVIDSILESNRDKCKLIANKEGIFLECTDFPTYLLATDKCDFDLQFLEETGLIDYHILQSILFQIFSAVITMNNYFGIKHNDLHYGNIMITVTDIKHLYYKFEDKYYKIPTYGFLVKIIDWGRATYEFNGFKGENMIFDAHNDCAGQYLFNRINSNNKNSILPSKNIYTDIVMISQNILSLLSDYRDGDIGDLLNEIIKHNNGKLDIQNFNWQLYKDISKYDFIHKNNMPRFIFRHKLFKDYIIGTKFIEKDTTIYNITPEKSIDKLKRTTNKVLNIEPHKNTKQQPVTKNTPRNKKELKINKIDIAK